MSDNSIIKVCGLKKYFSDGAVKALDGIDIEIDDDWSETGLIDPEEALAAVGPEALQNYIEPATPEVILKHLTPYDLADSIDLDEIALRLLKDGYTFTTIVAAATDAQLIEI